MNNRYIVIKQVLDAFSIFEETSADSEQITFDNFLGYLNDKNGHTSVINYREFAGKLEQEMIASRHKKEDSIAILVTYMYRYAKLYVKKALNNSPIHSIDDFSYLMILLTCEDLSKTELINRNVHEKTSGTEIIKRLIRNGLVAQVDDIKDKRGKRVSITDEGRKVVFSILNDMGTVSQIISGNLSDNEKQILIYLLKKLDQFHFDLFTNERDKALPAILEQVQTP